MSRSQSISQSAWRILAAPLVAVLLVPAVAYGQTGTLFVQNDKVGIGTATPTEELEVVGTGNVIVSNGGALQAKNSGLAANIRFTQVGVQSWLFLNSTTGNFSIFDESSGASAMTVFPGHSGSAALVVRDSGIDVNGSILQRGGTIHADYVFEPDYELESIVEHADLMWDNKHLPAVPQATVDEAGLEVIEIGTHQRGILEELEKAHIYIAQLHDRLAALEAKLSEQENTEH